MVGEMSLAEAKIGEEYIIKDVFAEDEFSSSPQPVNTAVSIAILIARAASFLNFNIYKHL